MNVEDSKALLKTSHTHLKALLEGMGLTTNEECTILIGLLTERLQPADEKVKELAQDLVISALQMNSESPDAEKLWERVQLVMRPANVYTLNGRITWAAVAGLFSKFLYGNAVPPEMKH